VSHTFCTLMTRPWAPVGLHDTPSACTCGGHVSSSMAKRLPRTIAREADNSTSCRVLSVDGTLVKPVRSARDLGIYIDADLVMRTHVQRTVSRCFAVLRQLRQIRHLVPTDTFQTLVVRLVLTRLDYGNSVLAGLPVYLVRRIQSVLNSCSGNLFPIPCWTSTDCLRWT